MYVRGEKPSPTSAARRREFPNTEDPDNVASSYTSPDALGMSLRAAPGRFRQFSGDDLGDTELIFRHTTQPVARVVSPAARSVAPGAAAPARAPVPLSTVAHPTVASIETQPRAWPLTDDALGDTTTAVEPAVISDWRARIAQLVVFYKTIGGAVKSEQATVARIPSGTNRGQLAYKYRAPQETLAGPNYLYTLAPADVRAADVAEGQAIDSATTNWATAIDQGAGQTADTVQRLATGTAKAVGDTTKGFLGGLLGIPSWSIPVVLGAGTLLAAKILLPGLLPWGRR